MTNTNGSRKSINVLSDLTPDTKNANKGTQRGRGLLEKSLRQYGAGRSVLSDKHGNLIAGNKTLEIAAQIDLPVRVVQTDGNELVVVQRTDLDIDSEAGRGLAIADNRTSEVSLDWDADILSELSDTVDLTEFWKPDELEELLGNDEFYTKKISSIVYEPNNHKPNVSELVDTTRTDSLIDLIEKQKDLPDDIKRFLILAAYRHTVFNYSKIADYYAHSDVAIQEFMQDSVLVLIDAKKAIELGYMKFTNSLIDIMGEDYAE